MKQQHLELGGTPMFVHLFFVLLLTHCNSIHTKIPQFKEIVHQGFNLILILQEQSTY